MNGNDQRYLSNVERQKRRVEALLAGHFSARGLPKARSREELAMKLGIRDTDINPFFGEHSKLADDAWSIYSRAREAATKIKQKAAKTDKPKKKGAVARKAEAKKAAKK